MIMLSTNHLYQELSKLPHRTLCSSEDQMREDEHDQVICLVGSSFAQDA